MNILNRKDETFFEFLKKYWWVEFLIAIKVIIFISRESYGIDTGVIFLLGGLFILWILYRAGLE